MATPRRLYLYRHAKSDWAEPSLEDIDRPLNKRGRKAAEAMARHIVDQGWRPDFIICSPSRRTRATLDGLLAEVGKLPVAIEDTVYEARSDDLLACLRAVEDGYRAVMVNRPQSGT